MAKPSKPSKSPKRTAPPDQPQTAEIGWLNHELADHPVRGLTPQRLYHLHTAAEQGDLSAQADLGMDMEERDGHIFAELSKRKRAVIALSWDIQPPRNPSAKEKKLAEEIREWVEDIEALDDILFNALDAVGHGYSAQEISWERRGALWLPERLEHVSPRQFVTPYQQPNVLNLRDGSPTGAPLWELGWLLHTHKAKSGYLSRSGLHRVLCWPFLFKNYSVRDLAEFIEIYGLPLRLGKYPSGATEAEKTTLLRAVMSIGHNAAGIIPQGMALEFEEAAKGTSDPHMAMIDWCEKTVSKAVLGGTLTSQADGKSSTNALGTVHNEVRRELVESDALQLARSINTGLIAAMLQLNKPDVDTSRYPRFVFDLSEPEDVSVYANALPKLVGIGMRIPRQWAHSKLGIPEPEDDGVPVLGGSAEPAVALAANRAQVDGQTLAAALYPDQAALDQALNGLDATALDAQGRALAAPILAALAQASNATEALGLLAELQPDQSAEQLQRGLEQRIFAAHAWGRVSVADEMDQS